MPELAYEVSRLAQNSRDRMTVQDLYDLNAVIKEVKQCKEDGRARLTFRALDVKKLAILTPFDASCAKEASMKSQAGFMSVMTTTDVLHTKTGGNLVEFQSGIIKRVVKSTMAAESASISIAIDRQLYLRLLVESILYGEPEYGEDWRKKLKVPGNLITDAKSLYDHLGKTGSIPKDRSTHRERSD